MACFKQTWWYQTKHIFLNTYPTEVNPLLCYTWDLDKCSFLPYLVALAFTLPYFPWTFRHVWNASCCSRPQSGWKLSCPLGPHASLMSLHIHLTFQIYANKAVKTSYSVLNNIKATNCCNTSYSPISCYCTKGRKARH